MPRCQHKLGPQLLLTPTEANNIQIETLWLSNAESTTAKDRPPHMLSIKEAKERLQDRLKGREREGMRRDQMRRKVKEKGQMSTTPIDVMFRLQYDVFCSKYTNICTFTLVSF